MARAYSMDLRKRVIALIEKGMSRTAAAAHFSVSAPSAIRWAQRKRETGEFGTKQIGGHRPMTLAVHRSTVLARLAEKPDLTLRTLVAELKELDIPATYGNVQRFLKAEGISFKKKPARRRTRSP